MNFPTAYKQIIERMDAVDPVVYGKNRNYLDGAVTYLSPYISRGVISTKQVFESILNKGFKLYEIEKFVQELAWRDYWQQIWKHRGADINNDFRNKQEKVSKEGIPINITNGNTGIAAIDKGIHQLYETGYMHNHLRMYLASTACNVAECHWKLPAQWMYYHLLDADWASNALSWQWVCGANAHKLYYANQENINRFCNTDQKNTFLDFETEQLRSIPIPNELENTFTPNLACNLPTTDTIELDPLKDTLIYNFYNLDPNWRSELKNVNRVLLLEPSVFEQYPVSQKSIDFMIEL
ncbi:MAG TPA: FAD-binding domain-containing protein, partial [Bacteroidia bacterium]